MLHKLVAQLLTDVVGLPFATCFAALYTTTPLLDYLLSVCDSISVGTGVFANEHIGIEEGGVDVSFCSQMLV